MVGIMENNWQKNLNTYYQLKGQFVDEAGDYFRKILIFDMGRHHMIIFNDAVYASEILDLEMRVMGSVKNKEIAVCLIKNNDVENCIKKLNDRGRTVVVCKEVVKNGDRERLKVDNKKVVDLFQFRIQKSEILAG